MIDGSVMQTAGNIGAITLKDGSVKAKVQLLPFDGDEYGVFAFVDSILLLNEAQCSERLSLAHNTTTPNAHCAARAPWAVGRYCTGRKARGTRGTGFKHDD